MLVESLKYIHPYIVGLNFTSYFLLYNKLMASPMAQWVENLPTMQETQKTWIPAYDAGDTEDMDPSHVWVRKIP